MKLSDILCTSCSKPYTDHNVRHPFMPPDGWKKHNGKLWDVRADMAAQQKERGLAPWYFKMEALTARTLGYVLPPELPDHWIVMPDANSPTGRRWVDPTPAPEWCLAV